MKTLYPMDMKTMKDQNDLKDWVTKLVGLMIQSTTWST